MLNFARHRRLRHTANLRAMVRETRLHKEDLIYPIFVVEGENQKKSSAIDAGSFSSFIGPVK